MIVKVGTSLISATLFSYISIAPLATTLGLYLTFNEHQLLFPLKTQPVDPTVYNFVSFLSTGITTRLWEVYSKSRTDRGTTWDSFIKVKVSGVTEIDIEMNLVFICIHEILVLRTDEQTIFVRTVQKSNTIKTEKPL